MTKFSKVALILFLSMMVLSGLWLSADTAEPVFAADAPVPVQNPIALAQTGTFSGTFTFNFFVYLPITFKAPPPPPAPTCPTTSTRNYNLIPVPGNPADRADFVHGDLNLSLRGWEANPNATLSLVGYTGATDGDAPQIRGVFTDGRLPTFTSAYQVYDWDWGCTNDINGDGINDGCRGNLLTTWDATLLGMQTTAGEELRIPSKSADIYQSNYRVLVLYAEEKRMTIKYTRSDTVVGGYTVHFENVCVDPNLLALYQSRVDANGWRINNGGYQLPALNNGQTFGTALGDEILIAMRDNGSFMDPRSQKDWWK